MPRDGSGNYSLPIGNPVANGTIIASLWANSTMADIAVQLNNVLTRDGILGPVGPFKLTDGTLSNPGLAFNSEPGLGIYRPAASVINFAAVNAIAAAINAANASSVAFGVFPRVAGESSVSLNTDVFGTSNTTFLRLRQAAAGGYLESIGVGTGVALPITYTASQHTFNGPTNLAPPGMYAEFMRTTAPSGWIAGSGGTIGSAASGATNRANADCQALFTLWWSEFNDAQLPIQTSTGAASTRGASAAADWAANKRLTVFDVRNRFARAADGANTVIGTLYADTFASHAHGINDAGHAHAVADPGHAHSGTTDAQGDHQHGRGESTGINLIGGASGGFVRLNNGTPASPTDVAGNHAHNLFINGAGTGIGIHVAGTGISIQANGSPETRPKSIGMLGCFKL